MICVGLDLEVQLLARLQLNHSVLNCMYHAMLSSLKVVRIILEMKKCHAAQAGVSSFLHGDPFTPGRLITATCRRNILDYFVSAADQSHSESEDRTTTS